MNDTQFQKIAAHYDALMAGVPYKLWVDYLEALLKSIDYKPKTVLDVACGTGNVTEILAGRGYDVVGVDISSDMIEIAKSKNTPTPYYVADMAQMQLDRKFDLAISLFDSLNYVTDVKQLAQGIEHISAHLNPGGVFIFDVNTIYALSHHFFDQANLSDQHYPRYVWTSKYDHTTRICHVKMVFEVMEDGENLQFTEVHVQRGHSFEELTQMLLDAGFEVLAVYNAYKFRKPTRRSDRVFYVARRIGDG